MSMRLETHSRSSEQSEALGEGDCSRHREGQARSMCLLEKRRNRLVAGGGPCWYRSPLPSREIFCSVLLAEEGHWAP